jgi:hypothetical protein
MSIGWVQRLDYKTFSESSPHFFEQSLHSTLGKYCFLKNMSKAKNQLPLLSK